MRLNRKTRNVGLKFVGVGGGKEIYELKTQIFCLWVLNYFQFLNVSMYGFKCTKLQLYHNSGIKEWRASSVRKARDNIDMKVIVYWDDVMSLWRIFVAWKKWWKNFRKFGSFLISECGIWWVKCKICLKILNYLAFSVIHGIGIYLYFNLSFHFSYVIDTTILLLRNLNGSCFRKWKLTLVYLIWVKKKYIYIYIYIYI